MVDYEFINFWLFSYHSHEYKYPHAWSVLHSFNKNFKIRIKTRTRSMSELNTKRSHLLIKCCFSIPFSHFPNVHTQSKGCSSDQLFTLCELYGSLFLPQNLFTCNSEFLICEKKVWILKFVIPFVIFFYPIWWKRASIEFTGCFRTKTCILCINHLQSCSINALFQKIYLRMCSFFIWQRNDLTSETSITMCY